MTTEPGSCATVGITATSPGNCGEETFVYSIGVIPDNSTIVCGANGLQAILFTLDTLTVDLSGDGSPGNPLTADVILTPDGQVPDPDALGTGNLIKEGAPGIYVSCEDVQDCVGAAISQIAVTDCLDYDDAINTIQIRICGEPNGIECVPAGDVNCPTGGLAVIPSSDANNALTFGTDDRLYAPAVAVAPGECMTFTGSGTVADPFVISPLVAPEQNGLECIPGQGLAVIPSSDPGNGLVFGADQRLFINRCPLAIGAAQVLTGNTGPCFEFVGGADCVTPMVATLRISDDPCQGLFCGQDGLFVRSDPTELPAPVVLTQNFGPFGPFNGAIPDTTVLPQQCITLTNPSPCLSMAVTGTLSGFVEIGRTSGHFRLAFIVSENGGINFFAVSQAGSRNPQPANRTVSNATWTGADLLIPPLASLTECIRLDVTNANDPGQPIVNGRVFSGQFTFTVTGKWAR